ncbi:PTS-dependent dihydroxyacetone kinase phosphotransferase subunit DhaM [Halobacillus salinarum]|uniref:phosphoenolpyruvate--glycerone phosphotransferase n=1 Tax=Halobacillus salinarum TaxID=2932257 RepID=A0ABY4EJ44_9BACI|nr:dihydroxyacetone kinase phosphoryl donor subunit DhaM [Halobacillus salinarum]UOQ43985.1 PTS-dependent dihydroxyacetone kinase phosphotransferase subunit DhaM [Halobacillus salinarum]
MEMVGLVIVSHSPDISKGLKTMLSEAQPEVTVIDAGGTDEKEMGTSAIKIQQAIEQANKGKGVAVLVDFGSSVMNAEMAIDMLDEEVQNQVKIADAPLIEGAYSAVMEAGFGKEVLEVVKAAEKAKNTNKIN